RPPAPGLSRRHPAEPPRPRPESCNSGGKKRAARARRLLGRGEEDLVELSGFRRAGRSLVRVIFIGEAHRAKTAFLRRPHRPIINLVGSDHQVIGKVGRVVGSIPAGRMGEVMIPIRGGSESYFAYAADATEELPQGTRVVVVEHDPPRTVIVTRLG